jgi:hypothetical protein
MQDAACRGIPPEQSPFFSAHVCGPECNLRCLGGQAELGKHARVARARAICATCSVQTPCLKYALSFPGGSFGIWAGTTERQRYRLKNPKNRSLHTARTIADYKAYGQRRIADRFKETV